MIIIDNIERIKRINDLAKELIKHGIATNSEEATRQAIDIVNKEDSVREVAYPNIELRPEGKDFELKQKVEDIASRVIKTNNEQILRELSEIKQVISNLNLEIAGLKEQLKQTPNLIMTQTKQEFGKVQTQSEPTQQPQQQEYHQIQQSSHLGDETVQQTQSSGRGAGATPTVRTGNYKPGDKEVQIDRFFYFGRK